ncbi:MAG: hypothetical protein GY853_14180 [PVC group bacterium]|nr:hypothetical protein [PVC group bacterium]
MNFEINMTCVKCGKEFDRLGAQCGLGTTWSLWRCPHCQQLQAKEKSGGFIPEEMLGCEDVEIIKDEGMIVELKDCDLILDPEDKRLEKRATIQDMYDRVEKLYKEENNDNKKTT